MTADSEEKDRSRDSSRFVDFQSLGNVGSQFLDLFFPVHSFQSSQFSSICDSRSQVHSALLMQGLPDPVGDIEHNCLKCQYDRDPLIIAELLVFSLVQFHGNFVIQWNVISILNKAIIFYILFPASLEFCRHPTLDWRPYVSENTHQLGYCRG